MSANTTKEKSTRPQRTPINGTRSVLKIKGQEAGYQYRIVNDEGDRVAQLEAAGYEIVTDPGVQVGDRRVAKATQEGTPVKVSVGGGVQGYVMRIRKDWYDEDQANKLKQVNEIESQMKKDAKAGADYGDVKFS